MHSSVMAPPLPKAIEAFALMVKQTAQMLQSFGTELAETELPNDVPSTSSVLRAHTEKKDKAKVCVASVGDGGGEGVPCASGKTGLWPRQRRRELSEDGKCPLLHAA